jgi:hypothetical protein
VAILQTLLTQRIVFHTAAAGSAVDRSSPAFSQALLALQSHAVRDAGSTVQNAASQASALLSSYFGQQMFVWGINDDFFISAMCTAACLIPILILRTRRKAAAAPIAGR